MARNYGKQRRMYYWLAFATGYLFPIAYFYVKYGLTKKGTSIVLPVILLIAVAIIKLASDLPLWVRTWRPSFMKGMVKAIPKFLLFIILITLGLTLMYILEHKIDVSFKTYFEAVFVIFGSQCVSSVLSALQLKYKELDLMSKGYVLGVINK